MGHGTAGVFLGLLCHCHYHCHKSQHATAPTRMGGLAPRKNKREHIYSTFRYRGKGADLTPPGIVVTLHVQ